LFILVLIIHLTMIIIFRKGTIRRASIAFQIILVISFYLAICRDELYYQHNRKCTWKCTRYDLMIDEGKEAATRPRYSKEFVWKLYPDVKILINIPVIILYAHCWYIVKQSLTRSGLDEENSSRKEAARYLHNSNNTLLVHFILKCIHQRLKRSERWSATDLFSRQLSAR
jgi:hypothetical protein